MNFRKPIIAVLLCATLVVGVSVAEAVNAGRFTGRTSAKDPVGFRVDGSNRVHGFFFNHVRLKCSDKDSFTTGRNGSRASTRDRINSSRRFTVFRSRSTNGLGWTFRGRFGSRGRSASGTLRVLARFDIENRLSPRGRITCDSGLLRWTVRRR